MGEKKENSARCNIIPALGSLDLGISTWLLVAVGDLVQMEQWGLGFKYPLSHANHWMTLGQPLSLSLTSLAGLLVIKLGWGEGSDVRCPELGLV